jgi:hypothetical protein
MKVRGERRRGEMEEGRGMERNMNGEKGEGREKGRVKEGRE